MDLLVAVDGSDESDRAIAYAADLATATGGSVTLLHAVEPDIYDAGGSEPTSVADARDRLIIDSFDAAEAHGRTVIDEAVDSAAARGVDAAGELVYGEAVRAITDHAEAGGFDAICVGHRGRSGRSGQVLGSVARDVVERATVPVIVVR